MLINSSTFKASEGPDAGQIEELIIEATIPPPPPTVRTPLPQAAGVNPETAGVVSVLQDVIMLMRSSASALEECIDEARDGSLVAVDLKARARRTVHETFLLGLKRALKDLT